MHITRQSSFSNLLPLAFAGKDPSFFNEKTIKSVAQRYGIDDEKAQTPPRPQVWRFGLEFATDAAILVTEVLRALRQVNCEWYPLQLNYPLRAEVDPTSLNIIFYAPECPQIESKIVEIGAL